MNEYDEYATRQNHIEACEEAEVIPFGVFAGRNLDWDCELNWEQRAAAFVDAQEKEFDRIEALRYDVPESALPSWSRNHEDRID